MRIVGAWASTCWRSSAWSGRSSAARGSPSGCSPTASARYAAGAGAARPSTSPRASAPRRRWPRRSALEAWRPHDIEVVVGARRRPRREIVARAGRARRAAERACEVSLTHSQDDGRGGGGASREPGRRARPARAAARRRAMRAVDRWAIEERGDPVAGADGARRRGARRPASRSVPRRARWPSSAARATTAATASSPRGCCARPGATSRAAAVAPPRDAAAATPRASSERLPGEPPRAVRRRARWPARRWSSTRCSAPASRGEPREPGAGAIAAINAAERVAGGRRRRPQRRRRRRPARSPAPAVRAVATATFARRQARAVDPSRQGARRRRSRVVDIGIPAARPASAPTIGLIARRRPRRRCRAAARDATKFTSGHVLVVRRLARASPARRAWPPRRRCAPAPATSSRACRRR